MSRRRAALLLKREAPDLADQHDPPGAVLARVRAALDSGDPAMVEAAYVVLRRAMRRLLLCSQQPEVPPAEAGGPQRGLPEGSD